MFHFHTENLTSCLCLFFSLFLQLIIKMISCSGSHQSVTETGAFSEELTQTSEVQHLQDVLRRLRQLLEQLEFQECEWAAEPAEAAPPAQKPVPTKESPNYAKDRLQRFTHTARRTPSHPGAVCPSDWEDLRETSPCKSERAHRLWCAESSSTRV